MCVSTCSKFVFASPIYHQVWRLLTSQFVSDNSYNLLCSCAMLYHFLILERRWGSSKYVVSVIMYIFESFDVGQGFFVRISKHPEFLGILL